MWLSGAGFRIHVCNGRRSNPRRVVTDPVWAPGGIEAAAPVVMRVVEHYRMPLATASSSLASPKTTLFTAALTVLFESVSR